MGFSEIIIDSVLKPYSGTEPEVTSAHKQKLSYNDNPRFIGKYSKKIFMPSDSSIAIKDKDGSKKDVHVNISPRDYLFFISEDIMRNTFFLVSREKNYGKSTPRIYEVYKYNTNNELISTIGPIDDLSYTEVLAPVYVKDNGEIFHLSTSRSGVKFSKWCTK